MSKMKRPTLPKSSCCAAMLATVLTLWAIPLALAQDQTPPSQGTARGENFSAKPPAALFASDCTGSGCHKGPQGLGKNAGIGGLAGFLREHYTNSRESAAALANYLSKIPSGPEQARDCGGAIERPWWMVRDAGGERGQAHAERGAKTSGRSDSRRSKCGRPYPAGAGLARVSEAGRRAGCAGCNIRSASPRRGTYRVRSQAGRVCGQAGGRCRNPAGASRRARREAGDVAVQAEPDRARSARPSAGGDRCGATAAACAGVGTRSAATTTTGTQGIRHLRLKTPGPWVRSSPVPRRQSHRLPAWLRRRPARRISPPRPPPPWPPRLPRHPRGGPSRSRRAPAARPRRRCAPH